MRVLALVLCMFSLKVSLTCAYYFIAIGLNYTIILISTNNFLFCEHRDNIDDSTNLY